MVAVALAVAVVTASTGFLLRPAQTVQQVAIARAVPTVHSDEVVSADQARGLHLYLIPHADDELSGWTSLADGSELFPVLVLLTQGEMTARCTPEVLESHLEVELGELPPTPDPTTGRDTANCRQARWNAFQASLGQAARHTPAVDLAAAEEVTISLDSGPAHLLRGGGATVIALDLGDGELSPASVQAGVTQVLELTGSELPDLPLTRITASGYVGESASGGTGPQDCSQPELCPDGERAYDYAHPDHVATGQAARELADRTEEGAFLITHPFDPAATEHRALPPEVYDAFMELGPGGTDEARRVGSHQRVYGWLGFPDVWRVGDLPLRSTEVVFPRVQSYEVVAP